MVIVGLVVVVRVVGVGKVLVVLGVIVIVVVIVLAVVAVRITLVYIYIYMYVYTRTLHVTSLITCVVPLRLQLSGQNPLYPLSLPPILPQSGLRGSKRGSVQALTLQEVYICAAWCLRRSTSCEYSDLTLKDSIWKITTNTAVNIVDDSAEAGALNGLKPLCLLLKPPPILRLLHQQRGFCLKAF